jgi:phosphatidate cytidylyltransferase
MPLNLPTFYKRTGTAIVFAAVMLTGLLWNDWAFLALICLINTLCLYEYCKLMQLINKEAYWPKWIYIAVEIFSFLFGIFIIGEFTLQFHGGFYFGPFKEVYNATSVLFLLVPIYPITLLLITALSKKTPLQAMLQSFWGILYITLPLTLFFFLRLEDFILPLAVVLMIWTNDTMAYLVGSFIGKTPFSKISPKKTWEGTVGGGILTVIGAAVYGYLAHRYAPVHWIVLAAIVATMGTLGDLFESKLKRMADVKDSGNFMPGHGGALDRFDSLLVATPFAFVYAWLFMV